MRRNVFFYIVAFAIFLLSFLLFSKVYQQLILYSELINRTNTIYSSYQKLSKQIKVAAVLNPDLANADNSNVGKLFFTDRQSIIQELDTLNVTVRDSINIRIAKALDLKIKAELPWIINSNVPDSIIHHKSPTHLLAIVSIDSLIEQGIQRTNFLLEFRKNKLRETVSGLRTWLIIFIILSFILITYTTINLFRQKSKTKSTEKEVTDYKYALDVAAIVAITDQKGIIKYVNENFCKISKYEREELIGQDHRIINSRFHPKKFIRDLWVTIANGKIWKGELKNRAKDGTIYWVDTTIIPFLNELGKPYQYVAIRADITMRKQAEQEIIKAYNENETVLNRISDGVVSVDSEWRYTFLNGAALATHPLGKEETLGKVIWDVHPEMHGTIFWDKYHEAMLTGKTTEIENYYAPMDLWFSVKVYPSADGLTIFYKNVSENKKAEQKLSKSLREIADYKYALDEAAIVAITDQKGIIKYVNENFSKISKYSRNELIGQDHRIINSEYHSKEFIRNLWVTIANGKIWKGDLKNKAKDGTIYWVDTTIVPFLNEEGKPYQYVAIRSDITDRKNLEVQQELFTSIVNFSDDAIISKTLDGIITSWNNGAEKLFGYNPEEVVGKHISILIPGDLLNEENEIIGRIRSGKVFDHYETKRIKKDGKILCVSLTVSPVKDPEGIIIGASKIVRDITQRKEAEEKLAASEKRFRVLVENNYDIISLVDEAFKTVYRSPSASRILGFTEEELKNVGTTNKIHPDDIAKTSLAFQKATANPGKKIDVLFRACHKDGHYIWLEGFVTNMLHDENTNAYVSNFRDITQRVEAQEKLVKSEKIYRTIASSIPGSVICLLDSDYRYLLVEGDMAQKLGYTNTELLGNKAVDVLTPKAFAGVRDYFKRAFDGETITMESDRNGYDVISRFVPLKDENNIVYAIMTVAIDVTELKNAQRDIIELNRGLEEKVNHRTEQLKKSNEEMEAFSYSVSHDLRAPLRGIIGFASILEEEYENKLDDEAKRIISIIKMNTLKMGNLIDDLLAFSRMGKQIMMKIKINTQLLVSEIIDEQVQATNRSKPINWKVNDLPSADADLNTIRQVWINLISNAVKYSGNADQPSIEIGSYPAKSQVVFYVKDNGVGFDEAYKDKLFKVFQRLHSEEEFEGTGVGLALVEKIISRHGGKVWAEGKENEGACFYFSIPT